jgi:hypothetical protein
VSEQDARAVGDIIEARPSGQAQGYVICLGGGLESGGVHCAKPNLEHREWNSKALVACHNHLLIRIIQLVDIS